MSTSGARSMIADGVLENPKVDAMVGQHVWPDVDAGKVGIKAGAMMAASDRFFITVKGKSTHGSQPQCYFLAGLPTRGSGKYPPA